MSMKEKKVGTVTHYYGKLGVAIVKLSSALSDGDTIKIAGKSDEFSQTVESMEDDHKKVAKAKKGVTIGLKVEGKVRKGDSVYIVS